MTNQHTIRFVVETLRDEDLMIGLLKNMTGEDISNLLNMLDTVDKEVEEHWMDVIRKTNIWI